jgi:hypothetical protein
MAKFHKLTMQPIALQRGPLRQFDELLAKFVLAPEEING